MKKPEIIEPTLTEILRDIGAELDRLNGSVSDNRHSAVESQLRVVLRGLGFRPRETKEKPLDLVELHKQTAASLAQLKGEAPADRADFIIRHAKSVLSNLKAENPGEYAPETLPAAP